MLNIILSGAPGSGKGTQSDLLVAHYGLQHLSTGDVLRKEIKTGSELGKQIDELISKGNLVPDDMMYGVIDHYLANLPKDSKGMIFDGYPRTVAQAEALSELLKKYNMEAIMIDMLVDEQLLIQRLIERGKVSGRADDNLNTIRHRIAVYHNQTEPIANYYLHQGNYFAVNGNHTVEEVFMQLERVIDLACK
ncbi:MAG: adenylate kinase [Paludibacteraceae bacterium]|jgi:adenylate kinase|nr:adenylate kinase [Paludibacteraceae bacterium]MBR1716730.1 adenylate kinase [Paludibacteraceae bacterium]